MDSVFLRKTANDLYSKVEHTLIGPIIKPMLEPYLDLNPAPIDPLNKPIKMQYCPFKLPIKYLDTSIYPLSQIVANDLELDTVNGSTTCLYDSLFQPKHAFAKNMIQEWKTHYSTHIPFLNDTQLILQDLHLYCDKMNGQSYSVDCSNLLCIWKDTKEDVNFLEKYSYMDWDMLEYLNHSPQFLQILSIANITSPLMSLIVPILFLIFPFLILKIQKIPITFTVYIDTLKSVAKNHFIGKTLLNLQSLSWDKIIYLFMTFGLYIMQIYQNINSCFRFYRNIAKINTQLCDIREYLKYSIHSIDAFIKINLDKSSYTLFIDDASKHLKSLKLLYADLQSIQPFASKFGKIFEIGYMLKCYYDIHSNQEYSDSIQYSFGFEGYINNMLGIYNNIISNKVAYAGFDVEKETEFKELYYPQYKDSKYIVNNCNFAKNMIITGPNASGKTTLLKSATINIIFSQQVGCGFYSSCVINPYTHIHSYLNIPDTSGRDSLFQAESRRCKDILDIITTEPETNSRHFCIFDELYSGTNPDEATKSAYSFLLYLTKYKNVNFILTTHYVSLCKKMKKSKNICNYKMIVNQTQDKTQDKTQNKLQYTYKIKKGISKIQGAIRILEDMNYPDEILNSVKNY